MNPRIARIVATGGLAALMAVPAFSQIPVPPLPNLEVHITNEHPPRARYERRTERPGPDYVWVAGSYDWQDGRWAWIPGRWERPEQHAYWVKPQYVRDADSWRYEPGHWSNQRLAEGTDYRDWHERHHQDRKHDRRWDRERDRDQNRDGYSRRDNQ
jgi:hypothetical protein